MSAYATFVSCVLPGNFLKIDHAVIQTTCSTF